MSDKSKIEWTDATWNPVTGCSKVSEGCRNCYAMKFAERWKGTPGHYFEHGFDITLRPDKLVQPYKWKRPRRIFVNSMSDLFHRDIPDDYIWSVFEVMARCPQHTFQVLTKRPKRMWEMLSNRYWRNLGTAEKPFHARILKGMHREGDIPYLPNVWLGVSVENQHVADERIPLLIQTPAEVRFLSCEPLLGPVNLREYYGDDEPYGEYINAIDWVIVGGESGPSARPMHPDWVRDIRDQCQGAGVPFFFKQWGEWHPLPWKQIETDGKAKYFPELDSTFLKLGKKQAGRMLDLRTCDEMPRQDGGEQG